MCDEPVEVPACLKFDVGAVQRRLIGQANRIAVYPQHDRIFAFIPELLGLSERLEKSLGTFKTH